MRTTPKPTQSKLLMRTPSAFRVFCFRVLQCAAFVLYVLVLTQRAPPEFHTQSGSVAFVAGTVADLGAHESSTPGTDADFALGLLGDAEDARGDSNESENEGGESSSETDGQDDIACWNDPPYLGPPGATLLALHETQMNSVAVRSRIPRPSERV